MPDTTDWCCTLIYQKYCALHWFISCYRDRGQRKLNSQALWRWYLGHRAEVFITSPRKHASHIYSAFEESAYTFHCWRYMVSKTVANNNVFPWMCIWTCIWTPFETGKPNKHLCPVVGCECWQPKPVHCENRLSISRSDIFQLGLGKLVCE